MATYFKLAVSKPLLVLLIGILNAGVGFGDLLIATYAPPSIASGGIVFFTAVVNSILVYLTTEEDSLPASSSNEPQEVNVLK